MTGVKGVGRAKRRPCYEVSDRRAVKIRWRFCYILRLAKYVAQVCEPSSAMPFGNREK